MSRTWFMHARARAIVQQGVSGGASSAPAFSFTDPTFGGGGVRVIIDDGAGGKFVGGLFTSVTCNVTSTTYTTGYERLIHLLPTGEVDSAWSCPVGSTSVSALALDTANDVLYVGGNFSTIGGATRADLAAVTASTGVVDVGWTCDAQSFSVNALALDVANDVLYVGGSFSTIGGVSRSNLAAVTASTGVVDAAWTCNTASGSVTALALDVANDVLYVGGNFSTIGGATRADLAAVTASTGVVDVGWTCDAGSGLVYALALDTANDVLYVGGSFSAIGGATRADLAAVTASTGVVDAAWTCNTASGDVRALAVDSSADRLYVGGSFTNLDSASPAKLRLAAVTASTGDVDAAWQCDAASTVRALHPDATNDALFVGGDFNGATGLDGEQRDYFGTVVASTGDLFVP